MIDKDVAEKYGLDQDHELDPDFDPNDLGPVANFFSKPFLFFCSFGLIGIPFALAYLMFLVIAGTATIVGVLWLSVVMLFYIFLG